MGAQIDLLGCEYLGGCPTLGSRVLSKVELHFDHRGLTVAISPQGLFTLAAARPVLALPWSEIRALSAKSNAGPNPTALKQVARLGLNVFRMRLDLPNELTIATAVWAMAVGVRVAAADLTAALLELLASHDGPAPAVTVR